MNAEVGTRNAEIREKPTVSRIVHYVLPDGFQKGEHRGAMVVRVFEGLGMKCNLRLFLDGKNDDPMGLVSDWRTSVDFDPAFAPGTWHWPERE